MTSTTLTPPTAAEFLRPNRVALYRHIDANGELLYIGITSDPVRRWREHQKLSTWARFVADTSVRWFDDLETARRVETRAITRERPLFNVARAPGPPWERRKGISDHQLAYLRTGVSGLWRRVRCVNEREVVFCIACGPDADARLDESYRNDLARSAY